MQPVDLTTLVAVCHELAECLLPARLEQVYQHDRHTLSLCLRTLAKKQWLTLSWHPQAARLHLGAQPPQQSDTFTFSQQIWHQVTGLALVAIALVDPWERVVDLQFAKRPNDAVQWHLYAEIMGKYSNVVLVNAAGVIVTAAHQVSDKQSRVRPIQTGDTYALPPALLETIPTLTESFEQWRDRLILIPQDLKRSLLTNYRGLSTALVRSLLAASNIPIDHKTNELTLENWQSLFENWQTWLQDIESHKFSPVLSEQGYTVIDFAETNHSAETRSRQSPKPQTPNPTNTLLNRYYSDRLAHQEFQQLSQQLQQALQSQRSKLQIKLNDFEQRLAQSDRADFFKNQADLLMAHLQDWQVGMQAIALTDFATGELVTIDLDPQLSAVQNAQTLYKKYQKQNRAKLAIAPLLDAVNQEIHYLEQVQTAVSLLEFSDLAALQEIRVELIQQGYLKAKDYRADDKANRNKGNKGKKDETPNCHRYSSPSGFEIWVGRNNYQNDSITFRIAGDYDLWFHAQEISGSHVLLRLEPGSVPEQQDLQTAADLAAYYSQARQSDRVPVVYTEPKHVFKPKGAKPGMVVYKHERIIWGQPHTRQSN